MDNGQQLGQGIGHLDSVLLGHLDQEIGGASPPAAVQAVRYYVRENYGTEHYYPTTDDADMVCRLMGTKTLSPYGLKVLREYGHTVTETFKPSK